MRIFQKIYALVCLGTLFLPIATLAGDHDFPGGCRPVGFSFKYHVLMLHPNSQGGSQSIYFIHNKGGSSVHLYQMRTGNESYMMHKNNTIKPKGWAVYAADENVVKFICATPDKSKYGQMVDCEKYLKLCEYPNVKFSINNYGNYWVVTNAATALQARRSAIDQGILLRW